jgi:integrase
MTKRNPAPRRERVERNIYKRLCANGRSVFEIGYRDSTGRQRWQTVEGGITAARAARDDILGRKGRGERVQPNPRLRFRDAADGWFEGQAKALRPKTQEVYENALRTHLRPRWDGRRLDDIDVNQVARLVRELRAAGQSEWSIKGVTKVLGRVFKYAQRRMGWHGDNPVDLLEAGERPKTSPASKRRIFQGTELEDTLRAASARYRLVFIVASLTGARLSEVLGLVWSDLLLDDREASAITFEWQVDRNGKRSPLKTEESRRTVEIPRQLAMQLLEHRVASSYKAAGHFVFCSSTGRPLGQRNVTRALRQAQSAARTAAGRPTFPALHEVGPDGESRPVRRGEVPSFHGFRHTAASEAIAAGESAEEVSWQLGHKNSVVTRTIYVQEIKSAERSRQRRERLESRFGPLLHRVAAGS